MCSFIYCFEEPSPTEDPFEQLTPPILESTEMLVDPEISVSIISSSKFDVDCSQALSHLPECSLFNNVKSCLAKNLFPDLFKCRPFVVCYLLENRCRSIKDNVFLNYCCLIYLLEYPLECISILVHVLVELLLVNKNNDVKET